MFFCWCEHVDHKCCYCMSRIHHRHVNMYDEQVHNQKGKNKQTTQHRFASIFDKEILVLLVTKSTGSKRVEYMSVIENHEKKQAVRYRGSMAKIPRDTVPIRCVKSTSLMIQTSESSCSGRVGYEIFCNML